MLAWFAAWVILFFPLGMGSVPETNGRLARSDGLAHLVGVRFQRAGGLIRPAGWLSIAGLWVMSQWLPELGSRNLQLYFWVASYFTMFFSFSERLTLGKIAVKTP